jgi:hypothetical protein
MADRVIIGRHVAHQVPRHQALGQALARVTLM